MAKETPTKKKNKKSAAARSTKSKDVKSEALKPIKTSVPLEVKPSAASTPVTAVGKLARWYKWLGFVLLIEGLAVVILGKSVTTPITLQYPAVDTLASESNGHQILALASRHLADVHIAWIVAVFLIVFGAISLMLATVYRSYLEASIKRGVNAFRWLALGLGGGLMVSTIALLTGISSLALLVALFGATLASAMLGLAAETVVASNGGLRSRLTHVLCSLALISSLLPWVVFGLGALGAVLWNGHVPAYLYSIYACQFVLFIAVLLATHFRLKRQGKWAEAAYTDRGYLLLAFVSATLLAAQVFAGVLK